MVWDTRGIFIIHEPTVFFCEFLHETNASQLVLLGEEWQQKAADANRQVTWQRFSSNSVGVFCIMLWYNLFAQLEGNMGILMEVVRILVIKLSSHRSLWTHLKNPRNQHDFHNRVLTLKVGLKQTKWRFHLSNNYRSPESSTTFPSSIAPNIQQLRWNKFCSWDGWNTSEFHDARFTFISTGNRRQFE